MGTEIGVNPHGDSISTIFMSPRGHFGGHLLYFDNCLIYGQKTDFSKIS